MNCLRTLARAAAPTALLIGLAAAPAMAADDPAPNAPATVSTSPVKAQVKTWHWMGNYGTVYEAANAANGFGAGAGEFVTQNINGAWATFLYY